MLQFPLFDLRAAQVGDDALSSFLVATFREYWAKAERAGVSGSFYAWVDEQADQLRCSFVQGVELPFDCRVEVVVDPGAIVNQALRVPAARGIPLAELDSVEWTDLDSVEWTDPEQVDDAFVLTVYARVVNVIP